VRDAFAVPAVHARVKRAAVGMTLERIHISRRLVMPVLLCESSPIMVRIEEHCKHS
jgi:hypothetical protein